MPLFDYHCESCAYSQEHFIYTGNSLDKKCPKCGSELYERQLATFRVDVEYSNSKERYAKKIMPAVNETYAQIGREALNDDTRTLDNVFGNEKVKDALDD